MRASKAKGGGASVARVGPAAAWIPAAFVLGALGPLDGCSSSGDAGPGGLPAADAAPARDTGAGGDDTSSGAGGDAAPDAPPDAPSGRDLSSDRAKFFGASRCATSGLLFCEDFESGALDTKTWTVTGTTPVVDGLQHARGAKALHVTKTGNGASYVKETKTFPAAKNSYFGRMFVWFKSLPTAPGMTYAHWTFAAASGTGVSGEIRLSGQLQNGSNHFGVGTDDRVDANGTGDWTNSDDDPKGAPRAVPTGEWLCIEWQHAGATNETRFFWDAVEHASLYTSSSVHGGNANPYVLPQFTNVWIGWDEYQTSTEAFEMWVDEIAIDPMRIGCVL